MATKVKLIADGVITPDQITLTTASTGTNTTAPATTAFVQQEISALVDSSPEALNTLNELAAALGDDANFSTTVTNSIATKAPLDSPVFSSTYTSGQDETLAEFRRDGGAVAAKIIYADATTDMEFGTTTSHALSFITGDTRRVTIDSLGNVGIGTDNPAYNLDIWDATDPAVRVYNTGTGSSDDSLLRLQIGGSTARNFIYFGDTDDSDIGKIEYNHSDNSMRFTTNTAEALRITSTGEVVVGGTASIGSARFTVDQNSGASIIGADAASASGGYIQLLNNGTAKGLLGFGSNSGASSINNVVLRSQSGDLEFQPNGSTTQMNLHYDGSTTLKLSSYASMLRLASGAGAVFGHNVEASNNANEIIQSNTGYYGSFIKMYYNNGIAFHTMSSAGTAGDVIDSPSVTGTQRMRILSDGEIVSGAQALVDTYSPLVNGLTSDALVVARSATQGSLGLWRTNTNEFKFYHNAYGYMMTFAGNGVMSGDFNDTSDRNLKENITDLNGGLSVINQLQPRNFDWKKEEKANGVAGFIAQEVEEILPNEVFGNDYVETESDHPDDVPADNGKHLNYNGILAHAVKAIQEQQTMIEDLKARIETLEG